MAKTCFKMEHTLDKKQSESARIREKYPDRIPVIVEKAGKTDVPEIDKKKFSSGYLLYFAEGCLLLFCCFIFRLYSYTRKYLNLVFFPCLTVSLIGSLKMSYPSHLFLVFWVYCFDDDAVFLNTFLLCRYLVPADLTVGQFVYVVRKRIKLSPEKSIFVFVKSTLPPTASLMSAIYEENKDEDGFLYMTYSGENTFGSA